MPIPTKNHRIPFTAPGVAELIEDAMPVPADGEVLVKIVRSAISAGTERANLIGDRVTFRGPNKPFPRQCGYSAAGIVAAVGNGVRSVKVGDRVACSWTMHAAYCTLPESRVYPLSDKIDFGAGALAHIATFPLAAVRKCAPELGESALVMGLGILGLIAVQLLRISGVTPIVAIDPVASKREQALALGADYAVDPFEEGFAAKVKELTGGGVNVAIEVTGKGAGLDQTLDCMRKFGRVALLGCTRDSNFTIDYYGKVHGPGITLIGAHTNARPKQESFRGLWTDGDDARAILRLIGTGRIDLASLVQEVYEPADAPEVFARLATASHFPVTQFDWSKFE